MKKLLLCLLIITGVLAGALVANASLGKPTFNQVSEPAAMLLAGVVFIGISGIGKGFRKNQ